MSIIIDMNPYVTEVFIPIRAALISMARSRAEHLALLTGVEFSEEELENLKHAPLERIHSRIKEKLDSALRNKKDKEAVLRRRTQIWETIEPQFPENIRESAKEFWEYYSPSSFRLNMMLDGMKLGNSWLANEGNFSKIKKMTQEGKILGISGDWSSEKFVSMIKEELSRRDSKVSVVYTSNLLERIFENTGNDGVRKIINNIKSLPTTNDAILLTNHQILAAHKRDISKNSETKVEPIGDLEISRFDVPGKEIPKQDSDGRGPFRSLLLMFGVSAVMGLVLPAITKAASSPVATQVSQGDIIGAGVSMLQIAGIGLGLIAGGIAIKYGVKAVRGWVERRTGSTITEGAKATGEITLRDRENIKADLMKTVRKELMVPSRAVSMDLTPTQASVMARRIVEEFLKGVIPVNEVEREALIKAVTKVEVGTIRGEPVNFTEMVLGEVPGRENIQRALLEERGRTLEELLQELLRNKPGYLREVVYFYQGVLIPEGATLSRFEKEFFSQSLVLRTLQLLHELAPKVGFNVAAETWAQQVKNLREEYGAVLLKQLALPEKMQELERAVGKEIESAKLKLSAQRIIEAIRENRVEELPLPQKEIVLRAVMRAKIWNHGSSIWEVLEQVFGVVPGQVPPSRISGKEIKLTYMPQEKYERLEQKIAGKGEKEVFLKSRAMIRVRETGAEKWQVEVILNGGYNTLSGLFYRALHELVYAMVLNVQGRLPAEGQVNRELAGLINYYLTAGGIFERLDKGVEYTLSREMIRFIREVPEKGLTEGIVPSLIKAMPALVDMASEISTFEPIAGYEIRPEVMDFEGMEVFAFDIQSLWNVKVKFGEITVEPRSRAVFKVMENIVKVAEKKGKLDKIKFAFVSNIRGLSKEVMEQMLIDYMRDYGLSLEVGGKIIDKRLILDRFTLRQTGRRISTKDVYDAVIRALAGRKAEKVTGIKVTILTDNEKRWKERMREILWVILASPKKGEILSTATG
ncbi:MAG: hypothetical protein V3U97_03425, partial [bacterium]